MLARFTLIFLLSLAFVSSASRPPTDLYLAIVLAAVFLSDMAWDLLARRILQRQRQPTDGPVDLLGQNLGFWCIIVVGATLGTLNHARRWNEFLVIAAIQLGLFWGVCRLLAARER